jgi:hypothetical protein
MIYIGVLIVIVSPPPPEQATPPPASQPVETPPPARMERYPGLVYVECENCLWENGYETMTAAKQGLASHRTWCKKGHGRKAKLFG